MFSLSYGYMDVRGFLCAATFETENNNQYNNRKQATCNTTQ